MWVIWKTLDPQMGPALDQSAWWGDRASPDNAVTFPFMRMLLALPLAPGSGWAARIVPR